MSRGRAPMPTKLALSAIVAFSALFVACDSDRTAEFCINVCECSADGEADACTGQCVQSIDNLELSNSGPPIVSDDCFACASTNACEIFPTACNADCASLINALNGQDDSQTGVPLDTN